jgi:arabinose-5-phosphate isomerase
MNNKHTSLESLLTLGRQVLEIEALAITKAAARLGPSFAVAVRTLLDCPGRVVLTGVGKSGHIARKIAATLASTGTPSFFVHPAEAGHGDLGMIVSGDVVIGISHSGESDEVVSLLSFARRFGASLIGISGNPQSRLGKLCDTHLDSSIDQEACPLGIAPTASTAVQLALGDALAMATLQARGFTSEDFAARHPLGALGRRFFLRVKDVMTPIATVPLCTLSTNLLTAISDISKTRLGAIVVTDGETLAGIFTDSDMRRLISAHGENFSNLLQHPIQEFVTHNPRTIEINELASSALQVFDERRISRLVCLDGKRIAGLLSWHDLVHHKIT